MSKKDFRETLLEVVDDALSCLGDSAKRVIYFHLETSFKIRKNDIPENVKAFAEAMEKTFGLGAKFLEILMMKKLHERIGGDFELNDGDFIFINYVDMAQRVFEEQEKAHENVDGQDVAVEA